MQNNRYICKLPDGSDLNLNLDRNFREWYVFIDDDKGAKTGSQENSLGIYARTFENLDCSFFFLLTRLLINNNAHEWHSRTKKGLQHSLQFRQIMKTLDRCRSRVFTFRRFEQQIDNNKVLSQIFSGSEGALDEWKVFWPDDRLQARLLFWSIRSTFRNMLRSCQSVPKVDCITFIVDNMDFFPENSVDISPIKNTPGMFLALDVDTLSGVQLRVVSFKGRSNVPLWMKLYLNLVDGESWLHGRYLRSKTKTGESIESQGLSFSALNETEAENFQFSLDSNSIIEPHFEKGGNHEKLGKKLKVWSHYHFKWKLKNRWVTNGEYLGDSKMVLGKPKLAKWLQC